MNAATTKAYQDYRKQHSLIFQPKNQHKIGKTAPLDGGYSLVTRSFQGFTEGFLRHCCECDLLDQGGNVRFTWRNLNDDGAFAGIIHHRNGQDYLIFRQDLYGYSVLEVATGQTFDYIPSESFPMEQEAFQETFIWTGAVYDPCSNLLAADGCLWACPSSVVLLDFSNPLKEQVQLDVHELVDPSYDLYDDIVQMGFGASGICLNGFSVETGNKEEILLSYESVKKALAQKSLTA